MPEFYKVFLQGLTDKQADELWLYLDADPRAAEMAIEILCDSHPNNVPDINLSDQ